MTIPNVTNNAVILESWGDAVADTVNAIQAATDPTFLAAIRAALDRPSTTAARPSAATLGAGARYYDTTLSKPAWSDGTVWRDATGTAI